MWCERQAVISSYGQTRSFEYDYGQRTFRKSDWRCEQPHVACHVGFSPVSIVTLYHGYDYPKFQGVRRRIWFLKTKDTFYRRRSCLGPRCARETTSAMLFGVNIIWIIIYPISRPAKRSFGVLELWDISSSRRHYATAFFQSEFDWVGLATAGPTLPLISRGLAWSIDYRMVSLEREVALSWVPLGRSKSDGMTMLCRRDSLEHCFGSLSDQEDRFSSERSGIRTATAMLRVTNGWF